MLHLVRLWLKNIRSYGEEPVTIDFSPGISLFSGDIGSGKSTILAAIEFGLFGLGDVKSTHLLRHDQKQGEVGLTFIAGEEEYTVRRTLVRNKRGVMQGECSLTGPAGEEGMTPSELKPRVLAILGFHERPDPKATSRIFRYAIYTPQEAMKAVLSMKEEQRLDILRRAFGIEQYRWAATNTEEVVIRQWLNTEIEIYDRLCSGLEEDEERYAAALQSVQVTRAGAAEQSALLTRLTGVVARTGEAIRALLPFREQASTLRGSLPGLHSAREARMAQLQGVVDETERIDADLARIAEDETALERLMPNYRHLQEQREAVSALEKKYLLQRDLLGKEETLAARIRGEEKHLRERANRCREDLTRVAAIHAEQQTLQERQQAILTALEPLEAAVARLPEVTARVNTLIQGRGRIEVERLAQEQALRTLTVDWEQIAAIGEGAPCPRCRQTLTGEHLAAIGEETRAKVNEIQTLQRDLTWMFEEAGAKIAAAEAEQAALEQKRQTCAMHQNDLAGIRASLAHLNDEVERLGGAVDEERAIREAIETGTFAADLQHQRQEILSTIEDLAGDVADYHHAREAVQALEAEQVEKTFLALTARIENGPALQRRRTEHDASIARVTAEIRTLEAEIRAAEEELAAAEGKLTELTDLETTAAGQQEMVDKERLVLDRLEREVADQTRTCEDLEREIRQKREKAGTMQIYQEQRRWLLDYFLPAVESIERSRLAEINETFNTFFQLWFTDLIAAEEIVVRVDEAFTPIVEQDGFEVDAETLSGGERTSLALAYRLALNTIVRKEVGADEESLLILDEPTDGFSAAQLYRLRDILLDAGCDQLIMVSHEKELEGFVDTLYQVVKKNGVSSVIRR